MALAAIPVLPAAPPAPPIFRFADGPPPNEVWAPGMAADPLLQVDADEPFAAYAACLLVDAAPTTTGAAHPHEMQVFVGAPCTAWLPTFH